MIRKMVLVLALSTCVAAAACNTVKGAGKDVESASDTTKNAINGR